MLLMLTISILVMVVFAAMPALASRLRQHRIHHLLRVAHRYLGTPYRWGGDMPGGFDCSGLVQYVYQAVGIRLPRTTWEQMRYGHHVRRLRPGDILFFFDGEHEGLYLGHGRFEDAPYTGARVGIRVLADYRLFTARRYINR